MGEFEDGDPDSGEVSDLHSIAPAVDDPRLPINNPREHALVFGDPGLDEPRHGGLTAHNLRAIADRASGLDAIGHDASATSLSSSSTTQRPPTTLAHDRCTPPHRRSRLAATSPGLSLAVAELRQAAASPSPSLAIAKAPPACRRAFAMLWRSLTLPPVGSPSSSSPTRRRPSHLPHHRCRGHQHPPPSPASQASPTPSSHVW